MLPKLGPKKITIVLIEDDNKVTCYTVIATCLLCYNLQK